MNKYANLRVLYIKHNKISVVEWKLTEISTVLHTGSAYLDYR